MFDGRYKLTNWAEEISEKEIAPRTLRQTGGPADDRLFAPRSLNRRSRVVTSTHGGRMQSAKRRLTCVTHRSRVALMDCDDKFAGVGDHASSRLV